MTARDRPTLTRRRLVVAGAARVRMQSMGQSGRMRSGEQILRVGPPDGVAEGGERGQVAVGDPAVGTRRNIQQHESVAPDRRPVQVHELLWRLGLTSVT